MEIVLLSRGNEFAHPCVLAIDIASRGLYRRRDGTPPTTRDISARAATYPHLFERCFHAIRLRLPGNPNPPPIED